MTITDHMSLKTKLITLKGNLDALIGDEGWTHAMTAQDFNDSREYAIRDMRDILTYLEGGGEV